MVSDLLVNTSLDNLRSVCVRLRDASASVPVDAVPAIESELVSDDDDDDDDPLRSGLFDRDMLLLAGVCWSAELSRMLSELLERRKCMALDGYSRFFVIGLLVVRCNSADCRDFMADDRVDTDDVDDDVDAVGDDDDDDDADDDGDGKTDGCCAWCCWHIASQPV